MNILVEGVSIKLTEGQIQYIKEQKLRLDKNGFTPINQIEVNIWPDFYDFWNTYDKKAGKKSKIEKKWDKLSQQTKEKIMEYIPNYIISQPDKRYRKNPETFLNNDGWEDELLAPANVTTVNRQTAETIRKNSEAIPVDFIDEIRGNK